MDTSNLFLVGGSGNYVMLGARPAGNDLSKEQALNLAAWLVAIADRSEGHKEFLELLDAIERT